ncbi:MAG: pyridoxal 5'-phosphate synthase glutaminase subunit PdxT [Acidimicrobiales bacterium]|jgi:5'-phosphate synthase pdxT subunit
MGLGVLALQGDVREHVAAVESLGEPVRMVRERADVDGLEGLIIPGGESTTLSMLLESSGLFDPLAEALATGLPVFGTCAGMILLAETVLDGRADQRRFGAIDLTIRRNGYGRQVASFESDIAVSGLGDEPVHAVFIRAPVVERAGPQVDVLATLSPARDGRDEGGAGGGPPQAPRPVVCRQGPVLCTSFHPELTGDRRLHQLFVEMTKEGRG